MAITSRDLRMFKVSRVMLLQAHTNIHQHCSQHMLHTLAIHHLVRDQLDLGNLRQCIRALLQKSICGDWGAMSHIEIIGEGAHPKSFPKIKGDFRTAHSAKCALCSESLS